MTAVDYMAVIVIAVAWLGVLIAAVWPMGWKR
jgi:hypothetical protein